MSEQLMLIPLTSSIQLPFQLLLSHPFAQCLCTTSAHIMNNMSALDEALDILPFTVCYVRQYRFHAVSCRDSGVILLASDSELLSIW